MAWSIHNESNAVCHRKLAGSLDIRIYGSIANGYLVTVWHVTARGTTNRFLNKHPFSTLALAKNWADQYEE